MFAFASRLVSTARLSAASAVRRAAVVLPRASARAGSALLFGGMALGGAGTVAFCGNATPPPSVSTASSAGEAKIQSPLFYNEVYKAIATKLDNIDYDDGSYGPVLVRLAWHAAGTYDAASKTGGSNGATMRFKPESSHGANAGLDLARKLLEDVKAKFPAITYADLWSLAGVVAIQEMGGPDIVWRPGRADAASEAACTPDGRLPDASKGRDHLRAIFGRMGFNDQEIVALSGAHALGRCHTTRSGFSGPWTRAPTTFSNEYYKLLLAEKWVEKKWTGPRQFENAKGADLMMLPTDLVLATDPAFKPYVELYAKDDAKFRADFAAVFQKLEELGVPFRPESAPITFKRAQ